MERKWLFCLLLPFAGYAFGWWAYRSGQGAMLLSVAGLLLIPVVLQIFERRRQWIGRKLFLRWNEQWLRHLSEHHWLDSDTLNMLDMQLIPSDDEEKPEAIRLNRWFSELRASVLNGQCWSEAMQHSSFNAPSADWQDWIQLWLHARTFGRPEWMRRYITGRLKTEERNREIRSLTAKLRTELIWLTILPYLMLAFIDLFAGDYVRYLFDTATGHLFMTVTITGTLITRYATAGKAPADSNILSRRNGAVPLSISYLLNRYGCFRFPQMTKKYPAPVQQEEISELLRFMNLQLSCGMHWVDVWSASRLQIITNTCPAEQDVHLPVPSMPAPGRLSVISLFNSVWTDWRHFVIRGNPRHLNDALGRLEQADHQRLTEWKEKAAHTQIRFLIPTFLWLIWICVLLAVPVWMEIQQTYLKG